VLSITAILNRSLAVMQSGVVFSWGRDPLRGLSLRPNIFQGFGGVRIRRVCAGERVSFAVGETGELSSWGRGDHGTLGHGNTQPQPSPKRVEAQGGVQVSNVAVGLVHALALAEDGLVHALGVNMCRALLGYSHVWMQRQPTLVAIRGVRVGSIAAAGFCSYAVADTGEMWSWGVEDSDLKSLLGHGKQMDCPFPKPISALRGVKVDAVAAGWYHTLALADDGSGYAWGKWRAAEVGALGLSPAISDAEYPVPTPQRLPALLVAYGL
jgi:alpha-tubulin suppressor-like RCC1 family protein